MDTLVWIWIAIVCLSAVLEIVTMQMVAVWFTISGAVAAILAICGVVWWGQVLVFAILALVLLLILRRISLRFFLRNTNTKTNVDSVVGTHHKLTEEISPDSPGALKLSGVVWTAVSKSEETIRKGTLVEIVSVSGNKLVVKPVEEKIKKVKEK